MTSFFLVLPSRPPLERESWNHPNLRGICCSPPSVATPSWDLNPCLFPSSDGELNSKQGSQFLLLLVDMHYQKVLCCVELKSEMYPFLVLPSGMRGTTLFFFLCKTSLQMCRDQHRIYRLFPRTLIFPIMPLSTLTPQRDGPQDWMQNPHWTQLTWITDSLIQMPFRGREAKPHTSETTPSWP